MFRKEIETLMTKNSLVGNINKRKKAGTSRSKKKSTISPKAYNDMQKGWPKKKRSVNKQKRLNGITANH